MAIDYAQQSATEARWLKQRNPGDRWVVRCESCADRCGCWSVCLLGYIKSPGEIADCAACQSLGCNHGYSDIGEHCGSITSIVQAAYVGCDGTRSFPLSLTETGGYTLLFEDSATKVYGNVVFTAGGECTTETGHACNIGGSIPDGRDRMSGGGAMHGSGACPPIAVDLVTTFDLSCP